MATTKKDSNAVDYAVLADALHRIANELAKMGGGTSPDEGSSDEAQTYSSEVAENVTSGKTKKSKGSEKSEKSASKSSGGTYTEKYLRSLPIKELRSLGASEGVKSKIKGDIVSALTGQPVSGSKDQSEDDDESSEDSSSYTRDDLQGLAIKNLRGVAREYEGYEKGMSREDMIDLILGSSDTEDDDEFEDEDEDDSDDSEDSDDDADDDEDDEDGGDDEDDDEEEVVVTREELQAMTSRSLKDLHKEYSLKLPKTEGLSKQKTHTALVDSILEQVSDEDEDD